MTLGPPHPPHARAWLRQRFPSVDPNTLSVWSFMGDGKASSPARVEATRLALSHGLSPDGWRPGQPLPTQWPLHTAVRHQWAELGAVLLQFGARLDRRDASGFTPWQLIEHHGHWGLLEPWLTAAPPTDERWNEAALAWVARDAHDGVQALLVHGWDPNRPINTAAFRTQPQHGTRWDDAPEPCVLAACTSVAMAERLVDAGAKVPDLADLEWAVWLDDWEEGPMRAWWQQQALRQTLTATVEHQAHEPAGHWDPAMDLHRLGRKRPRL